MSWASLLHFPPIPDVPAFARGRSYAVVMAAHLGSAAEGASLLAPLRRLGPERDTFASVPTGRARRPRHGPARPGALPEHLGAARRAAARGDRRHAGRGGPGVRAWPDRLDAAAAPDGRRAGPRHAGRRRARHAAGRHQHVRARRGLRRADARGRRHRPRRRRRRPAALPRRLLPQLRRGAGRRQRLLRSGDLGAPAGGQGGLRPGQRVRRQPPHPAGLGVRGVPRSRTRPDAVSARGVNW